MTIPYKDFLQNLINELQNLKNTGSDITAAICVSQVDPTQDNTKMRAFAIETLKIDKKEFAQALHRRYVALKLGRVPHTAGEYVEIITTRRQTAVKYNGTVTEPDEPFGNITLILKKMRAEAAELKLPFPREVINDAVEIWFEDSKAARLPALKAKIVFNPALEKAGTEALMKIAESCFDEPDKNLVVAAIKKFIHQVKSKMSRLPVERHLMLVLLGLQGGGKSSLAKAIMEPLEEVVISCTMTDMANDRIIDMWQSYIGFCDEMVGGNKADNAMMKHVITADIMNRRPMMTNMFIAIPQNLTFLGTSNATEFQEILKDHTGTRRYIGLACKEVLDWDTVNSTDWLMVWQSVDETAADPMIVDNVGAVLKERQEHQREKSRVEVWLDNLNPNKSMGGLGIGQRKSVAALHDDFREFEETRFPGHFKTDVVSFGRQLSAIKNASFKKAGKHGVWIWSPESNAPADQDETGDEDAGPDDIDTSEIRMQMRRSRTPL